MRPISPRRLREFSRKFPEAAAPLDAWLRFLKNGRFNNPADLTATFGTVDLVLIKRRGRSVPHYVFNIAGNKYRLIATIHFNTQILYIRDILSHREYDTGKWKR
jgi:mRNA interferase HigB